MQLLIVTILLDVLWRCFKCLMRKLTGKSYIERLCAGHKLNGTLTRKVELAILDSKNLQTVAESVRSLRPFDVVTASKQVMASL